MTKAAIAILSAAALSAPACNHDPHGTGRPPPSSHAAPMTELALAMPIAPGKTEAWRHALEDLVGARYAEYDTSRRRFGLTSQTTFLQKTPMGDFALIHMTGPDVHQAFHQMSASQDPWDVQWRQLTRDLHGVDFARGDRVFPRVELAFSMESGSQSGARPFLFAAPLTREGAARLRAVAADLMGDRHAEYVEARSRIGVQREAVFLERAAMGDVAVFYWLAADPRASLDRMMESTAPLDAWLRELASAVHPVELDTLRRVAGANVLVAQYPKEGAAR
ncbi:MAG TPA: hypothetical protein VEL05_06600 [Candidatus Acidoferrum sp.]|nr:hypothetical protein [Candidatus Acidoferrum sp.]